MSIGAKRNLVFASVHDGGAVGQGCLRVIVHVLGRPAGNEMKDMVRGISRVNDDFTAMIAAARSAGFQRKRCGHGGR